MFDGSVVDVEAGEGCKDLGRICSRCCVGCSAMEDSGGFTFVNVRVDATPGTESPDFVEKALHGFGIAGP